MHVRPRANTPDEVIPLTSNEETLASISPATDVQPTGGYTPKWANEADEHKYARHTRNAAFFIAWVVGISAAVGVILGILAVIDLGKTVQAVNPSPSPTCYDSNDPSTIGLPVC